MSDEHDPLICAIGEGNLDRVKTLMNPDMDIDTPIGDLSQSALQYATEYNQVNIVQYLLGRHADLTVSDMLYGGLIHVAAIEGHLEVLKVLLDYGADINDQNQTLDTPLHEAVNGYYLDIVEVLLERGAKINLLNFRGDTPLEYASRLPSSPEMIKIIELLKRHGALSYRPKWWEFWKKK